ncbi:unnamed protein product [Acanthoscelides obtectus]|uniref:Uncharacterized protein n=1 Tax=Acanthoscelides obtectus TaxID=200917 RepID=A0A9P0KZY7_ACAOB|nr:unnamed protein product [Acanthoscelides obtectus]CAK1673191.1 hypothetical protein AOBTE_LOCUS29260 [Acanthoscelides obtectus]
MSSYSLALNTYFKDKRDKAVSLSMTISGLGPIVMPQVINQLMEEYTSEGVTLILAGICTHSFVAACLLQPVKYHQRKIVLQEMQEMNKKSIDSAEMKIPSIDMTLDDEVFDEDEVYHTLPAMSSKVAISRRYSQADRGRYGRKDSVMSMFSYEQEAAGVYGIDSTLVGSSVISLDTVLTVFILNDYGMDTGQIAEFLSVVAAADITFRFLAPYIDHVLKQPPRTVYLLSLVALVIIRSVIFLIQDVRYLFAVALALGCVKGIRIVNMYLIIPNYVPLERLASASGIQMVANGLNILIWSPLIGVVEDLTGSYQACILLINAATTLTVILWSVKLLMNRLRKKNEETVPDQSNTLLK